MAKRTSRKGMRIRDALPNRHYEVWEMGAANNTCTYSTFDLIAGGISPYMAWLIERVEWMPRNNISFNPTSNLSFRFQLATDEQTALLSVDDNNVVATKDLNFHLVTSGADVFTTFPITWVGPVLVASRKMTGLIDATGDFVTSWQSVDLCMTVWYKWVEMDQSTWYEVMQAQGILT